MGMATCHLPTLGRDRHWNLKMSRERVLKQITSRRRGEGRSRVLCQASRWSFLLHRRCLKICQEAKKWDKKEQLITEPHEQTIQPYLHKQHAEISML
jgi:hypothetical protein